MNSGENYSVFTAEPMFKGVISVESPKATLKIVNSTFKNNSMLTNGVVRVVSGKFYDYNSTYSNNAAQVGGAICISNADAKLNKTTFSNNYA